MALAEQDPLAMEPTDSLRTPEAERDSPCHEPESSTRGRRFGLTAMAIETNRHQTNFTRQPRDDHSADGNGEDGGGEAKRNKEGACTRGFGGGGAPASGFAM